MTGIELELISDVHMYLMIEKGLRGGMSVITHRKAVANNKYMSSYDPDKPSKYITYLDAKSLYSWSMNQYLPYGGFKFQMDRSGKFQFRQCKSRFRNRSHLRG